MKKCLAFLVMMAFFVAAPMVMAQDTPKKEPKMIKCCIKGECKDLTKKDCKKEKGKEVKDCSKCTKK
jgi:hypothetical protein